MLPCFYRKPQFTFQFPYCNYNLTERRNRSDGYHRRSAKNILDATLRVFDQKGLKFTMDDLAKELSISKKTIYTVYDDKEALFLAMVDYIFDSIKESEQMILTDPSLSVVENCTASWECCRKVIRISIFEIIFPPGQIPEDLPEGRTQTFHRLGAYNPADRDGHG